MPTIKLPGCRHNILGHYLKAVGLLRVLAKCSAPEYRDPDAEGFWNTDDGTFYLRSDKYGTEEKIGEFFGKYYQPTPVFSAWNTGGGLDEKQEIVFRCNPTPWQTFWEANKELLFACGYPHLQHDGTPEFTENGIEISLSQKPSKLFSNIPNELSVGDIQEKGNGKKIQYKLSICWSDKAKEGLQLFLNDNLEVLKKVIKLSKNDLKKPDADKLKKKLPQYIFDLANEQEVKALPKNNDILVTTRVKESGKKAVMVHVAKAFEDAHDIANALKLGREYFECFQDNNADINELLEELRDKVPMSSAEAMDTIFTTRSSSRTACNPLFLNKGEAGQGEIFRTFWGCYLEFKKNPQENANRSLYNNKLEKNPSKGKGTPFFPDAIKSYNIGGSWVEEDYPFTALDYILAVEGAFAMRGSVSRLLGSNTRRFAAFPFVFNAGEDLVDDSNKIKGTSSSLWFPIWNRPTTYSELSSFINDAQARLPKKDVRFSSEFLRALHSQGVDAGFFGWQEFRFRMRGSRVPWITTGNYCETRHNKTATILNHALAPLDKAHFIDQFEFVWKGNEADSHSPHPISAEINTAIENAAVSAAADNCLQILCTIFNACKKIAISKSFREKARLQRPVFFEPLPMHEWNELLKDLENVPEFDIARAVASIVGLQAQNIQSAPVQMNYSKVQPLLGSLLPLKRGRNGWYLPQDNDDRSNQAVWSGVALCRDLSAVLQRRYMDSSKDDFPALQAVKPARLKNIIKFLNGELDDAKISRWIEALSIIGWHFLKRENGPQDDDDNDVTETTAMPLPTPLPYAALRNLLDLECAYQEKSEYKHRRSLQPITQLRQCSTGSLAQATREALYWISIWGVRNPWGKDSRAKREVLKGTYVVSLDNCEVNIPENLFSPERIAAAVCIPLLWKDRWQLLQNVTLPISV